MKIKSNFVLRNIAGTQVALPLGDSNVNFTGMLTLNETGVLLWHKLESDCTIEKLADAITDEYEVAYDEALADVKAFLKRLDDAGCLEAYLQFVSQNKLN